MAKMLGAMVDCSRNAVMNVPTVKKFAKLIRSMGYNTLMLYTEDTYEVDNQPAFGYQRGRYSQEELRELDQFCLSIGMELIPCIQTLAHLATIFKWRGDVYLDIQDMDNALLVDNEKTYALIEDMISSLAKCFTTRKIHIGFDEAFAVGLGKHLQQHGYEERSDIITRHLQRVCRITEKYGFQPMIWSDMFCRLSQDTTEFYEEDGKAVNAEKFNIPQNVSLVHWDYYSDDYERYVKMLRLNQRFDREVIFAGGAWTWSGFLPDNGWSIDTIGPAMKACRDCGVDQILITLWGDDGGECSRFGTLPVLFYGAEAAQGNTDLDNIKEKFRQQYGCDFDAFLLLDELDNHVTLRSGAVVKHLLYRDPFMPVQDKRIQGWTNEWFAEKALQIRNADFGAYRNVADCWEALCDVLSVKCQLDKKTRTAYENRDKATLERLAKEDYAAAVRKIKNFHRIYRDFWMGENKPQGFEIQDIRMGGLCQRLETCQQRLLDYCAGKLEKIEELEEAKLMIHRGHVWSRTVFPGAGFYA